MQTYKDDKPLSKIHGVKATKCIITNELKSKLQVLLF